MKYEEHLKIVQGLQEEISRLKLQFPNHDDCIDYLIKTSSVFLEAADLLIQMRIRKNQEININEPQTKN